MGAKYGRLSIWGIGGMSNIDIITKDKKEGDLSIDNTDGKDVYFNSKVLMGGVTHTYFFNDKIRQEINVGYSGTQNVSTLDSINIDKNNTSKKMYEVLHKKWYHNDSYENKILANYNLNIKYNSKNTINIGASSDVIHYNYSDSVYLKDRTKYRVLTNSKKQTYLLQAYTNWQHKFNDDIIMNVGGHYQYLDLSGKHAIEPRFNLKYQFTPTQSVNIGAGMHSQMLPMVFYLKQNDEGKLTNDKLDFYKSIHYVLGYNYKVTEQWNFKTEVYYQDLYDIPVSPDEDEGHFSLLNMGSSFNLQVPTVLKNSGTGKNYGIDVTLEKSMADNYYVLLTGSLYESNYKGYDKVERSTLWNGNYAITGLAGFEFDWGSEISQSFGADIKLNYTGGNRYIPIDIEESKVKEKEVLNIDKAYKEKLDDYIRLDFKLFYKLDNKYLTQEWAVDFQNILNRKNIFQRKYNPQTQKIITEYQQEFLPMVTYRVYF